MNSDIPSKHTTIQEGHPRAIKDLNSIYSTKINMKIVPNPTKRYLKKLELDYLYCVDCESQEIHRNGKTDIGTQKFRCKVCGCQFVTKFDAVFPQSQRRQIFEREFLANIKPSGFDKEGTGRKLYWQGARLETLQMIESQAIKVRINQMLKEMPIRSDKEYHLLLEFTLSEAYGKVMG